MGFVRKTSTTLALLAALAFFSAVAVEGSHHHGKLESPTCSLCSFQQTGSQASSLPRTPFLVPFVLAFLSWFFQALFRSLSLISPSGRSPPLNLL